MKSLLRSKSKDKVEEKKPESIPQVTYDLLNLVISKTPNQGLGIAISGGKDHPNEKAADGSIVVLDVVRDCPSDGILQIGDIIISVNGISLKDVTHAEAASYLRVNASKVNMTIKRMICEKIYEDMNLSTENSNVKKNSQTEDPPMKFGYFNKSLPRKNSENENIPKINEFNHTSKSELVPNYYFLEKANNTFGITLSTYIYISEIERGSPADLAGIEPGDIVLKINDLPSECFKSAAEAFTLVKASNYKLQMKTIKVPILKSLIKNNESSRKLSSSSTDNYEKLNYKDNYEKLNYKDNYEKLNYKDNYEKLNYKDNYEKLNYKDNYENNESEEISPTYSAIRNTTINQTNNKKSPVSIPNELAFPDKNKEKSKSKPVVENLYAEIPSFKPIPKLIPNESKNSVENKPVPLPRSISLKPNNLNTSSDSNIEKPNNAQNNTMINRSDANEEVFEFQKENGSIGLQLCGGNSVGIFVAATKEKSSAAKSGITVGYQILMVNNTSFEKITREEAVLILLAIQGKLTIKCKYRKDTFEKIKNQLGDDFYIRVGFDLKVPTHPKELTFDRGDVFRVRDTMYGGVIGSWQAQRISKDYLHKPLDYGILPNKSRAEQLALQVNQDERRNRDKDLSSSHYSTGSLRRNSNYVSQDRLDAISFADFSLQMPAYEVVTFDKADFKRPVVIVGPVSDIIRKRLVDFSDNFELLGTYDGYSSINRNSMKKGDTFDGAIKINEIRQIVDMEKHCLLDLPPEGIEMLHYAQLEPIVIVAMPVGKQTIKDMRKAFLGSVNDDSNSKDISKMAKNGSKIEKKYVNLVTATVSMTTNQASDDWYDKLIQSIDEYQKMPVWIPNEKPDNSMMERVVLNKKSYMSGYNNNDDTELEESKSVGNIAKNLENTNFNSNINKSTEDYSEIARSNSNKDEHLYRNNNDILFQKGFFGVNGGILELPNDDISLYIPKGALSTTRQEIFIKIISRNNEIGPKIICGPTNLKFDIAVELRLPHKKLSNNDDTKTLQDFISIAPTFFSTPSNCTQMPIDESDGSNRKFRLDENFVSILIDHF